MSVPNPSNPAPAPEIWPPHLKERRPPPLPSPSAQAGPQKRPKGLIGFLAVCFILGVALLIWNGIERQEKRFEQFVSDTLERTVRERLEAKAERQRKAQGEAQAKPSAAPPKPRIQATMTLNDQTQSTGQAAFGSKRSDCLFEPAKPESVQSFVAEQATLTRLDTGETLRIRDLRPCESDPTHLHFDLVP